MKKNNFKNTTPNPSLVRKGIRGGIPLLALLIFILLPKTAGAATVFKDPLSRGLVGYWNFDVGKGGTKAYDMSGNGNNGTLTNMSDAAYNGWTDSKTGLGTALKFDGVDDYVSIPDSNTWQFTGDFSITTWVKYNSVCVEWWTCSFVAQDEGGGNKNKWIFSYDNASGQHNTVFHINSTAAGSGPVLRGNTWTALTGIWYFVGVTRIGNNYTFYRNGIADGSATNTYTIPNANTPLLLGEGEINGAGDYPFNGSEDEVHIYNRALSASEIQRLYNLTKPKIVTSGTGSLSQGLVGYWNFDVGKGGTTAYDNSGQGNNGILINMSDSPYNGWTDSKNGLGQALSFDGVDDYVSVGSAVGIQNDSSPFTFCAWVNPSNLSSAGAIVNNGGTASSFNNKFFAMLGINNFVPGSVEIYIGKAQVWDAAVYAPVAVVRQWQYMCGTYDGSRTNAGFKIFYNGIQQSTTVGYNNWSTAGTNYQNWNIGATPGNSGLERIFNGSIDDIRIYNRALSASEILRLYNLTKPKIDTANTNGTLSQGLVGYWTFNGGDINWATGSANDVSGQGNNGRMVGLGTTSASVAGKLGQALKFNGNNYVDVPNLVSIGKGFVGTVTFWAKGVGGQSAVANFRTSESTGDGSIGVDSSGHLVYTLDTRTSLPYAYSISSTATSNTSEWNFYAAVLNIPSDKETLYVNGVGENKILNYVSDGSFSTFTTVDIGRWHNDFWAGDWFNGSIDDVRIYNRALSASEITRLYNMGR